MFLFVPMSGTESSIWALAANPVRPQGVQLPAHPSVGSTVPVSWTIKVVVLRCEHLIASCLYHCIAQIDDFELFHDQPLASEFPKRTQDGNRGSAAGSAFARGRPMVRPVKPSWLPAAPRLAQSVLFYRADFPSEPAVGPEFRLVRTVHPNASTPRTSPDAENP